MNLRDAWLLASLRRGLVTCAALLTCSGCLMVNQDFRLQPQSQGGPKVSIDEASATSPSDQADTSLSLREESSIATSSSLPPQDTAQSSPTTAAPTHSSQASSTPGTVLTSASTSANSSSSSTSTTSDSGAGSGLPPGSIWVPIVVTNPASNRSAPAGTSVGLTLDHRSYVARGARLDGKDLRILSKRGQTTQELHRVLDPESGWNRSDTKIWFTLDQELQSSQAEEGVYHIVLENRAGEALADPDKVFIVYDDFNAAQLDFSRWTSWSERSESGAVATSEIVNGELVLTASSPSQRSSAGVRSAATIQSAGISLEAGIRFETHANNNGCTEETLLGIWSKNSSEIRAGWRRSGESWRFVNSSASGGLRLQILPSSPPNGDRRRHTARWTKSSVDLFWGTQFIRNMALEQTSFNLPSHGALDIGFSATAHGSVCSRQSRLYIDWVLARHVTAFEIQTLIDKGEEFTRP